MAKFELEFPKKVQINDITVRDGFQHEEIFVPTDAKVFYLEELILCGIKHVEVTDFGSPLAMPQFKDADEVLKRVRDSKKLSRAGVDWNDICLTVITIRERSVDRAIVARKEGLGSGPYSHDGLHRRGTPFCQLWDHAPRVLGGGRTIHRKGQRRGNRDVRHRVYHLGLTHLRTHSAGRRG